MKKRKKQLMMFLFIWGGCSLGLWFFSWWMRVALLTLMRVWG
jgi:hypothetical protein